MGRSTGLVRGGRRRPLQGDEPALTLLPRAAGQRHFQMKTGRVPAVTRLIGDDLEVGRTQQILRRPVVAVLLLNPSIEREFVIWPHMELKRAEARPFAVVDALAVLTIRLAARLPVTFEHRARSIVEGRELRPTERGGAEARCDRHRSNQLPIGCAPRHLRPPRVPVAKMLPLSSPG